MPRIRLAPQLSDITLDNVLSGETCEPISLADFEAYLTYKEHTPENLRFVVWYQDYRRRFFALPPDIQRLSPGPGAQDFDFALPTPARIARRVGRTPSSMDDSNCGEDSACDPLSPTTSIRSQCALEDLGVPLTPMSTAPLLRKTHSLAPSTRSRRLRRPSPLRSQSLVVPPPSVASVPQTPLTGPSLPSPSCVPCAPALQPFRKELTAVAHTFLLPSAPAEICLPALLRTRVLLDLAHNTHPDVWMPVYEAAYDALKSTSLPTWLKMQEENMGWEKKLYWWAYGALTTLIGWAVVWGCVFGANVRREWRLWAVPFLCLGGMQMYAGYRGFCTQIWGRGGMQLRPWELVHPSHVTLVDHSVDSDDLADEKQAGRKRSSTVSSTSTCSTSKCGKPEKEKAPDEVIQVACLEKQDEEPNIIEERRSHDAGLVVDFDNPEFDSSFAMDLSPLADNGITPSISITRTQSCSLEPVNSTAQSPPRLSRLRIPSYAVMPAHSHGRFNGYRDEWGIPPSCFATSASPASPASPSTVPASLRVLNPAPDTWQHVPVARSAAGGLRDDSEDPDKRREGTRWGWTRPWRRVHGEADAENIGPVRGEKGGGSGVSLSTRARVFGPERIVLDPRIRAVHRRVMRDILVAGFIWGVVFTVVVLVLPHRH